MAESEREPQNGSPWVITVRTYSLTHTYGPYPDEATAQEDAISLEETDSPDVLEVRYDQMLPVDVFDSALKESQRMHAERMALERRFG